MVLKKYVCAGAGALLLAACTVTLGPAGGLAYDINDSNEVVGATLTQGGGLWHAARYSSAGALTDLGTLPGHRESFATSVANDGTAAGYSYANSASEAHAVLWDSAGAVHDLGQMDSFGTRAQGINNHGVVVGLAESLPYPQRRAWIWRAGVAPLQPLPVPANALGSEAFAINDAGQIAGNIITDAAGTTAAVRWDGDDVVLLPVPGGSPSAEAIGINSLGTVVGAMYVEGGPGPIATVWPVGGAPIQLSSAGYPIAVAAAINDSGVVVGSLAQPDSGRGVSHAARWKPLAGGGYAEPELINTFSRQWDPPPPLPVAHQSEAVAINNASIATGTADNFAVRYDP